MSTTTSSSAPFILFVEKLERNTAREWREQVIPQVREGKVQWVVHPNGLQDPAVVLNTLRVTNGTVGDVGYIDPSNNIFRVLFDTLDPMGTGCPFQCNSITSFDNEQRTTHTMLIDLSLLTRLWPWRSAPPCAKISRDPYSAVDEQIIDGMGQRTLNLGMKILEDWTDEYADKVVCAYPDVTRGGLYLVTQSIAKGSPQTTSQHTMQVPLQVYTENLPAHMH